MSSLVFFSPLFEHVSYLPGLVFPFAKTFGNDIFTCFEILLTVILNWCQQWWEFYPYPPIEILAMIELILQHHDKELIKHYKNCGVTSQVIVNLCELYRVSIYND